MVVEVKQRKASMGAPEYLRDEISRRIVEAKTMELTKMSTKLTRLGAGLFESVTGKSSLRKK